MWGLSQIYGFYGDSQSRLIPYMNEMAYLLGLSVQNARIPNAIGEQDRTSAGGQLFPGRATHFNGTTQYAYFADDGELDIIQAPTDFCFSAHIKINDLADSGYVLGKSVAGAAVGRYGIYQSTSSILVYIETSTGIMNVNGGAQTLGWHHVAVRVDRANSRVYLYVDGQLKNAGGTAYTGTHAALGAQYEFVMGAGNSASGASYDTFTNVDLRDVRVYHKDITGQIADLVAGERLGDEVAWWWCEGKDSLKMWDASGNGRHLNVVNFDASSYVEGVWLSLMNKYGYAKNVTGPEEAIEWNTAAFWTGPGTTFVINEGQYLSVNGASGGISKSNFWTVNREYWIRKKISDITSGSLTGPYDGSGGAIHSANGVHEFTYIPDSGTVLWLYSSANAGAKISDLSIRKYYTTEIPADMSTGAVPTHDIFGNALVYKGQAKYSAISRNASCFVADGTARFYTTEWDGIGTAHGPVQDHVEFEVETFIPASAAASDNRIFGDGALVAGRQGFYMNSNSNYFYVQICDATSQCLAQYSNATFLDQWVTVKGRYDIADQRIKLYVNGTLVVTSAVVALNLTNLGSYYGLIGSPGPCAAGVKIKSMKVVADGNTLAQYEYVEGSGTVLYDVSGNGYNMGGVNVAGLNWGVVDKPRKDYLAETGGSFAWTYNGTNDVHSFSGSLLEGAASGSIKAFVNWNGGLAFVFSSAVSSLPSSIISIYIDTAGRLNGHVRLYGENQNQFITVDSMLAGWHEIEFGSTGTAYYFKVDGEIASFNVLTGADDGEWFNLIPGRNIHSIGAALDSSPTYGIGSILWVKLDNGTSGDWHYNPATKQFIDRSSLKHHMSAAGTGEGLMIIPSLADKSANVLGHPIAFPQYGKQLIPNTYFSMPENIAELIDADQNPRFCANLFSNNSFVDTNGDGVADGIRNWYPAAGTRTIAEGQRVTGDAQGLSAYQYGFYLENAEAIIGGLEDGTLLHLVCKARGAGTMNIRMGGYTSGVDQIYTVLNSESEWQTVDAIIPLGSQWDDVFVVYFGMGISGAAYWFEVKDIYIGYQTMQTGRNMVSNGGARNANGALTTTDWTDSNTDGLADNYGQSNATCTIVTGNGFSGRAQRLVAIDDGVQMNLRPPAIVIQNAKNYLLRMAYRANVGIYAGNGVSSSTLPINTGNAVRVEMLLVSYYDGSISIRLGPSAPATVAGCWMEVDELEILPIIGSEFYQEDLTPVIVGAGYFARNPIRYGTRYFNAVKWKDLILLKADTAGFSFEHHKKLLQYTQNL